VAPPWPSKRAEQVRGFFRHGSAAISVIRERGPGANRAKREGVTVSSRNMTYSAKHAGEKTLRLHRLNIGPRLTLCFAFIILAMLVGSAVVLWQFQIVRGQTERLRGVDQMLILVLQAHTNLMSFYERLDGFAHSEDTARLVREAEPLRNALLEDSRRTRNALSRLPAQVQLDPTLLPTLEAIQGALPAQLEAITNLATSEDWEAVRLRVANQVRELEPSMSALVKNIDGEVGEQRAEALFNIGQAQRRILLVVPGTAALTLLFAAFLGLAITHSITRPLGQLMEASKALGRGEFQNRVSVAGNDELAHLGRVFNDTAGTLRELYETVHTREAYLAEAQRVSHTGSWGWNLSSGELVWSDETFRIFEYSQTAKPSLELVLQRTHPDDVALVQQLFDRVSRGGTDWDLEHRLLMPDGSVKRVHIIGHASNTSSGNLEYVGAVTDVTAAKEAEEKIRQGERELRQLLDLSPQHISVIGPDGSRLFTNQVALDYYGLSLDVWTSIDMKRLFHPQDLERWTSETPSQFRTGSPHEFEARLLRRDGLYRWFLIRLNPILNEQGQLNRWYASATDIEDRKEAEQRLRNENVALREEIDKASMFEQIVGTSLPLQTVLSRISKVAPTDSSVLITGETGTGKELVARAIHRRSRRSSRPFVSVNCAAIPRDLIASELFGHEKGAFTGASQRRLGRFELADGGTIFLDEVGELPAETQIALLRVLQEREFERVGAARSIRTDVRVIAATNRDLEAAIASGTFRSDLFYRLNVFPIEMPSLRERREDIPLLVEYFIDRFARQAGKSFQAVNRRSLDLLESYPWPGNIRELQNVIERSVIVCDIENFSVDESWLSQQPTATEPNAAPALFKRDPSEERAIIEAALSECGGRVYGPSGAAAKLGMPRSTLESKIRSFKINKRRFKTAPS
jgi:PAS domain S-box-containing protein